MATPVRARPAEGDALRVEPGRDGAERPTAAPGRSRSTRRSDRREALLDAAVEAIGASGPGTTMTAMAASAGVTKPILYRHFGDRAGLYEALGTRFAGGLEAELREVLADGGQPPRVLLEAGVDTYLSYLERNTALYRFLTRRLPAEAHGGNEMVGGFVQRIGARVSVVVGEYLRRAGADSGGAEIIGFGITGMVQLAGERWLDGRTLPRAAVVRYLTDTLWAGLGDTLGR